MSWLTEKIIEGFYVAPNIKNTDELQYRLGRIEDILKKYKIKNLAELEVALYQYYNRNNNVQTRRIEDNE